MTLWLARWIMKCIAVKWLVSRVAFLVDRDGVHSFPHPFFFLDCSGFLSLSHPPLPLSSTLSIELGGTFLGTNVFVSIFFLSFINHPRRQSCVPHLPVDCSPHPWFCV